MSVGISMIKKNLSDGLKQKPTWDKPSYNMVESISNMQRRIDEYERFVNWALLSLLNRNAYEEMAFDIEACNTCAKLIKEKIDKMKKL